MIYPLGTVFKVPNSPFRMCMDGGHLEEIMQKRGNGTKTTALQVASDRH